MSESLSSYFLSFIAFFSSAEENKRSHELLPIWHSEGEKQEVELSLLLCNAIAMDASHSGYREDIGFMVLSFLIPHLDMPCLGCAWPFDSHVRVVSSAAIV